MVACMGSGAILALRFQDPLVSRQVIARHSRHIEAELQYSRQRFGFYVINLSNGVHHLFQCVYHEPSDPVAHYLWSESEA